MEYKRTLYLFVCLFVCLFVIVREVKHKSRLFTDTVECPSLDISKIWLDLVFGICSRRFCLSRKKQLLTLSSLLLTFKWFYDAILSSFAFSSSEEINPCLSASSYWLCTPLPLCSRASFKQPAHLFSFLYGLWFSEVHLLTIFCANVLPFSSSSNSHMQIGEKWERPIKLDLLNTCTTQSFSVFSFGLLYGLSQR